MRRALDAFHKEGLYPDTFSVKRYNQNINWQAFLPSPGGLEHSNLFYMKYLGGSGTIFEDMSELVSRIVIVDESNS